MLVGMIFRNEIQYCFTIDNILENHIFCGKDKTKEVSMNIVFKIYDLKGKKEIRDKKIKSGRGHYEYPLREKK